MFAEQRLRELGISLPAPPRPLGAYVGAVQTGNLLFLSGALPIADGAPQYVGRIGGGLTLDEGRNAVRLAGLNALALARIHLGSLDRVARVVRLAISLSTSDDFHAHPRVADAASDLLADVFGADKVPTRMIYGASSLPAGVCAIVELILEIHVLN